jgi:hypothetical protein
MEGATMFSAFSRSAARAFAVSIFLTLFAASSMYALGDEPVTQSSSDHYGLFGLLDHRSIYGQYWFPEPLNADESDVDNEIRVDWHHMEKTGKQQDTVDMEVEKSFGLLTLEVSPGYESDRSDTDGNQSGLTNIELGARYPIFQYVSPHQFFDTTFVFGLEISPPSGSEISKDTEFVPKLFNLTRLGEHLSIQTGLGDSILVGPEGRGLSTIEYGIQFGYELTHSVLPIPGILSTVPILEFDGEHTVNQDDAGLDELFGTIGFRLNFDSISWLPAQPRIGLGYTFPVDQGARNDFDWGIVTSIVFEY